MFFFISLSDKNLCVSISGDVDEAKALSKPPEDSQGTNSTFIQHYKHTFSCAPCCLIFKMLYLWEMHPKQNIIIFCVSGFIQMTRVIQMQRRSKRKRWVSGLALLPTHICARTQTPLGQWVQRYLNIPFSATDTQTVPEDLAVAHTVV